MMPLGIRLKALPIVKGIVVGACLTLLLGGCALKDRFFADEEEKPPAQLMAEGSENLEAGYYEAATDAFQKLKDRYPYSQYAVAAELKMADALFRRELYEEAYVAYSDFEKLHPKNPEIPYVIYQRGMCHFEQISAIDRDQAGTLKAIEEFERLVKRFRRDKYARRAGLKIRKCYIYLARHELYIGDFYFRAKNYRAAADRYRYVLEHYPDLGQYHEALESLNKAKEKLAEQEGES
jgi:outer membrane protein assembly factor BamD